MKTFALIYRGLAPLAAFAILAASTAIADAQSMGASSPHWGRGINPYYGPHVAPPVAPNYPHRPPSSGDQGGGGTGGFNPGGGSGNQPIKKPNLK
jgi:hypothetical protein